MYMSDDDIRLDLSMRNLEYKIQMHRKIAIYVKPTIKLYTIVHLKSSHLNLEVIMNINRL